MNVNLNIKIDYTINPIFTSPSPRSREKVFDRIDFKFNWRNITLAKGMLSKFDIITTLPYFESINVDYYTIVIEHIILSIIAKLHENLGIEIDKHELCDENMVLFENFISELKTNVKDIKQCLN